MGKFLLIFKGKTALLVVLSLKRVLIFWTRVVVGEYLSTKFATRGISSLLKQCSKQRSKLKSPAPKAKR